MTTPAAATMPSNTQPETHEGDAAFVRSMIGMQTYHDKTICYARITGGGHRFHGYTTFKFGVASAVLIDCQKNARFRHTSNGVIEVETRAMTDRHTCTGVVDPATLCGAPHNLAPLGSPIHGGAVSKHTFAWSPDVTDTLLHKLTRHPYVLDVWIETGKLVVFIVHDRNIDGGLMAQVAQNKHRTCRGGPRGAAARTPSRSVSSRSSSAWRPLSRRMKPTPRRG